jgi:hypothetical protein
MKPGLNLRVAGDPVPKAGKPPVVKVGKPGKMASVLKKRAALSPIAKAGIGVVVIAMAIAAIFFYRIFFPPPSKEVPIRPIAVKPVVKDTSAADTAAAAAKAAANAQKAAEALAAKRAADAAAAAAAQQEPTPTPATEAVMANASLSKDVKVNSTRLEAAPAASAAFRTFVAGAEIGGVFQGTPARALINGTIVREGQVVDNQLGITFDRIDADKKIIYFKDPSGAEVSKNY